MKGIRREKVLNKSGTHINLDGLIPYLREGFVFVDKNQPLTGDAPKLFIREYEYGTVRKSKPQKWPAYIAKVGHKWYPVESITEQLLTDLGELYGLNVARSKLALGSGQLRFLSRFFLVKDERLMHGAEVYAAYLNNDIKFVQEIEDKKMSREFFTMKFTYEALKYSFPGHHKQLFTDLLEMITFDAITGNNDRHFYNWGIIVHVRKLNPPRFAPIYDTARALFWNYSDKRIDKIFESKKQLQSQIEKYAINSKPKIGVENGKNLNHFELIGNLCERYPEYLKPIQKVVRNAGQAEESKLIDSRYRCLLTLQRKALIKECLLFRKNQLKKIISAYE
jgi:hypothetical protein